MNKFPWTNMHGFNLDWVIEQVKAALSAVDEYTLKVEHIETEVEELQNEVTVINSTIDAINNELTKIANGDYVSLYLDSIINWIENNIQVLVSDIVKYITFEINGEGYFIANIPASWDFLQFDTIIDPESANYGHLTFEW